MTTHHPYSYVTSGGVKNKRVKVAEEASLETLQEAFADPVELDVTSTDYHDAPPRQRTTVKMGLPYFVGGEIQGSRADEHVVNRTYLTLDVEQGKHDEEPPPHPRTVALALKKLGACGWVYTSLSHTDSAPRYRVVLPLGRPIKGDLADIQDQLQASTQAAAAKLGIAEWTKPESWVASQPMYLPAKLQGGAFYQSVHRGKSWRTVSGAGATEELLGTGKSGVSGKQIADIPDERRDEVLAAIKQAGLYLKENPKHPGMHFIVCPFLDEHGQENESQTVYYEAHFDGNPRPAVKCFDTEPDVNGEPHLTIGTLVKYLRKNGFMSAAQQSSAGVLDDDDTFLQKANLGNYLDAEPTPREWAFRDFAPVGKVTVLSGPGGVSKSMLLLHGLAYGALGREFGPFKPDAALKSLYVSYEDDTQEMHKRVRGLVDALAEADDGLGDLLYDVKGCVRRNLLMYAADDDASDWLILTKPDRYSPPERTERVNWLVGFLKRNRVRLLALDPLVYTHQLEENNIADMAAYMQTMTHIAKHANCAIVIVHHMSKSAGWLQLDDINQSSLRGASSVADNARSVGVVVTMPNKDATQYGLSELEDLSKYAVFKHVKHNYSQSLGTHVFERKGPLLIPRRDITKLNHMQLRDAKERQVQQDAEFRALSSEASVLRWLQEVDGFVTLNQLSEGAKIHKRRLKEVVQTYEENDWVEVEDGPRGAKMVRITVRGQKRLMDIEENAEK